MRRHVAHKSRHPGGNLAGKVGQLQRRELNCGINRLHRRNYAVVHRRVILRRQVVIDVRLVIDAPPRYLFALRVSRRHEKLAVCRKPARVVVLNEILCVRGKRSVRRIEKAVATVVVRVHESGSFRDLKLRAVIAHAQHRLRDRIERRKVPCGRTRTFRPLRNALRDSLQANVVWPQIAQSRSCRRIQREELVVPLRRLK